MEESHSFSPGITRDNLSAFPSTVRYSRFEMVRHSIAQSKQSEFALLKLEDKEGIVVLITVCPPETGCDWTDA